MTDDVQRLRDRVEELERLLGMHQTFPRPWDLTPQESHMLGLLLRRAVVSRETFTEVILGGNTEKNPKMFEVLICRLREKLRPHGIEIRTEWNTGYYIPPHIKLHAQRLIEVHQLPYKLAKPGVADDAATVRATPGNL